MATKPDKRIPLLGITPQQLRILALIELGLTPMAYCILVSLGLVPNVMDLGWFQ